MKKFIGILLVGLLGFLGCSDGGGVVESVAPEDGESFQESSFSEHDFLENPTLRIQDEDVAIIFLEPEDATETEVSDIHGLGVDLIPLYISQSGTHTYSLDSGDGIIKEATMLNSSGEGIFTIDAQTPTVSTFLQAGNYDLLVWSGYTVAEADGVDHEVVFLYSDTQSSNSRDYSVQYNPADVHKLLSTKSCPNCDLRGARLFNASLAGANLAGATMLFANLSYANLTGADLNRSYLGWVLMSNTNLTNAKLQNSFLVGATLFRANLTGAKLDYANLRGANLYGARLTGANLTSAKLTGANLYGSRLTNTTMPDGSINNSVTSHPCCWPF